MTTAIFFCTIGAVKNTAPSRKELSHERIVAAAARAIRRNGFGGAGVAEIMKDAGLTHGGFYAHFPSREAMLAEAADRAGAETVGLAESAAAAAPADQALEAMLGVYLSEQHINNPESGCPMAALSSELSRQAPEVRRAATRRMKEMVDVVARQLPGWGTPDAHERALFLVATMVGAVSLARAVDDPSLAERLCKAAFKYARANGEESQK